MAVNSKINTESIGVQQCFKNDADILMISGTVQAYQIAASGTLPQGVVMHTAGSPMSSPQQLSEEAARKRELRLLKNR